MIAALADTVATALRSLRAHRLRSALTVLGVVIGVVAVVAMAAAIEGLRRQISADLSALGTGVFQVQKNPRGGFGPNEDVGDRPDLTLRHVDALRARCRACLRVGGEAWEVEPRMAAGTRTLATRASAVGATPEFFANNGYEVATGRLLSRAEVEAGLRVAVVGADVAERLFSRGGAVGRTLRIGSRPFRIVGTLGRKGNRFGGTPDNIAVVPLTVFLPMYGAERSLNITVAADDPGRIEIAQDEVVGILRRVRGVAPEDESDFDLYSNASVQDTFESMTGQIAAVAVGICAVALLIGGIGVMNIMLVSVTERTSEIGLRRALGARRRRILLQFVVEAVTLTTAGGAAGLALGAAAGEVIGVVVGIPAAVPGWAAALSLAMAAGTGLGFGIYPAYRASRLDPALAMRRE